jgi:hypothetical protein
LETVRPRRISSHAPSNLTQLDILGVPDVRATLNHTGHMTLMPTRQSKPSRNKSGERKGHHEFNLGVLKPRRQILSEYKIIKDVRGLL